MESQKIDTVKANSNKTPVLSFLDENERQNVLLAAQQIRIPDQNMNLHKKIESYMVILNQWNKKNTRSETMDRSFAKYSSIPPFLAGVISSSTLPRVLKILNVLFYQIEKLGGIVNDDLSIQIRNERIPFKISEHQYKVKQIRTGQELLLITKVNSGFRMFDYIFDGKLKLSLRQGIYFTDTEKTSIESRLGDILISFYKESEFIRIEREAQEDKIRKREAEKRSQDEKRKLYNAEVEKTNALNNAARDYETACRIRAYVVAFEKSENQYNLNDKTATWIDWANKKADWYDPIIARTDELLGKRKHD